MINYYIHKAIILLGVVLSFASDAHASQLFGSKPTIHDMMRDGFFAQKLIKNRPIFLKTGGGYPALMIGGDAKLSVMHRAAVALEPRIDSVSLNGVGVFNEYTLLALPISYDPTRGMKIDGGALIFGDYSRYSLETKIGSFRVPLYGAIGQFASLVAPWRSKMIGRKNELGVFVSNRKTEEIGFLVGWQKAFGAHVVSVQGIPCMLRYNSNSKKLKYPFIINPQVIMNPPEFRLTIGLGYWPSNQLGSFYFDFEKDAFYFGGHRLYRQVRTKHSEPKMSAREGHLEGSYKEVLPISNFKIPVEVMLGYGWEKNFTKFSNNFFFCVFQAVPHKHCQLKLGLRMQRDISKTHKKNQSKKSHEYSITHFTLGVNLIV